MKNDPSSFKLNRRMVLRGAGGLMLGLPLLEALMPRDAAAQAAMRSPFVIIVVNKPVSSSADASGRPAETRPAACIRASR